MASGPITSWQIDGETVETVSDFIFLGSKITADGDCSHEMKRHLLLGRKVMTNLDSILKSRDILCQQRSVSSRLWFFQWSYMDVRVGLWRRLSTKELLLLNCETKMIVFNKGFQKQQGRSNQSILKELSPEYSLKGLTLKLKLQYFGLLDVKSQLTGTRPWCWERLKAGEEGSDRGWDGWMAPLSQWTWAWATPA